MSTIRARFAPSPTGHLHVGGARTALFNWLFCRRHGGRFVVRIEDTDVLRNIEGAEAALLEDLRWLGLDWDEGPDVGGPHGPYRQSERLERYDTARDTLLASGHAYHAFDTPDELDTLRRRAAAEKRNFRYPRPDPLPGEAEVRRAREQGRPVVVRFKAPFRPVGIRDEILGAVQFPEDQIDDFVIVKSNGWPTYHFAVVVDDAAMEITHVLRAQEHLMNTPKHVLLQEALGVPTPTWAHLPLVFNADGSKMSKRDRHKVVRQAVRDRVGRDDWTRAQAAGIAGVAEDAFERWLDGKADTEIDSDRLARLADAAGASLPEIDVHDFRGSGYLSEALANFIALIGWAPGDDREKMSLKEMAQAFSLERVNKTAGRFDRDKLVAINTVWAADLSPKRLVSAFRDYAAAGGSPLAGLDDATLERVIAACSGFRTFRDIDAKAGALFADDDAVSYDAKAVRKFLDKADGRGWGLLEAIVPELESVEPWSAGALESLLDSFCNRRDLKLGDLAQPIRVAVAGRAVSPPIHETLVFLGRDRTVRRVRRCLARRGTDTP